MDGEECGTRGLEVQLGLDELASYCLLGGYDMYPQGRLALLAVEKGAQDRRTRLAAHLCLSQHWQAVV